MSSKKGTLKYYIGKRYDGMMGRCYRETDRAYKTHGKQGIKVCGHWIKDINNFREWFKKELSRIGISEQEFIKNSRKYYLDRIDPYGHYTPENCRLTSAQINSRNTKQLKGKKITSAEGDTYEF